FSRPMTPESEAAIEGFQEDATCRLNGRAEKMLRLGLRAKKGLNNYRKYSFYYSGPYSRGLGV
ncbi:unnamed protein product, partial [Symbiodinium microadriaticum]